MKRKIIILLALIFITTGCTADYNLVIEDDVITETTNFYQEANDSYTKNYAYEFYTQEYPIFYDEEFLYYNPTEKKEGNTYYEKSITENNGLYTAKYIAKYNISNYNNSQLLNNAYKNFSIGYNRSDKTYYILANNLRIFNDYEYLDNLKISIDLKNYEVIESNSQSKNGTTYIWNFNKNSDGKISLKYKEKSISDNTDSDNNDNKSNRQTERDYTMYIFAGILLIVMLSVYFIVNKIKNKEDGID